MDDIIFNTLGGVLGWFCAKLFARALPQAPVGSPEITHDPGLIRRVVALWIDLILIALVTFGPWMFFDLASEVLFDKAFSLFGMNAVQTESVLAMVCFVIAFSEVELVFPWIKNGSTPGGLIVRMSFETRERSGGKRVLFYLARGAFLIALFALPQIVVLFTLVFYLIIRKMPYDYLPG